MARTDLTRSVQRLHQEFGIQKGNQSKNLWLCLMLEELGELTRAVLRNEPKMEIENELGDIIFVMEGFCQLFDYDLSAGVKRTIRKNDGKHRDQFGPGESGKVQRKPAKRSTGR